MQHWLFRGWRKSAKTCCASWPKPTIGDMQSCCTSLFACLHQWPKVALLGTCCKLHSRDAGKHMHFCDTQTHSDPQTFDDLTRMSLKRPQPLKSIMKTHPAAMLQKWKTDQNAQLEQSMGSWLLVGKRKMEWYPSTVDDLWCRWTSFKLTNHKWQSGLLYWDCEAGQEVKEEAVCRNRQIISRERLHGWAHASPAEAMSSTHELHHVSFSFYKGVLVCASLVSRLLAVVLPAYMIGKTTRIHHHYSSKLNGRSDAFLYASQLMHNKITLFQPDLRVTHN